MGRGHLWWDGWEGHSEGAVCAEEESGVGTACRVEGTAGAKAWRWEVAYSSGGRGSGQWGWGQMTEESAGAWWSVARGAGLVFNSLDAVGGLCATENHGLIHVLQNAVAA